MWTKHFWNGFIILIRQYLQRNRNQMNIYTRAIVEVQNINDIFFLKMFE